jgi:uncharacterized protein YjbJ (UPF0337 family)
MRRCIMNRIQIKGYWKEIKGKVKEIWGKMTGNKCTIASGKGEQVVGFLQQKFGYTKEKAEKKADEFAHKLRP